MEISLLVALLVAAAVVVSVLLSVLLPVLFVGGLVWLIVKTVGALRGGGARAASPAGPPPAVAVAAAPPLAPDARANRDIGWAVGLLVAGVLWCLGRPFSALLMGAGAAILTRRLLDQRRRDAAPRF